MSYLGVGVSPANIPVNQATDLNGIDRRVRLTELVLRFLVTANGIAAAYSLLQASRCIFSMVKGHVLFSKPLAWLIFSGDQLVAYLMLSATAAAGQAAVLAKFGQTELQWLKVCNVFGKFCNQIGEGIASGLLVSFGMAALSAISAFSLFRLYGGKKSPKR